MDNNLQVKLDKDCSKYYTNELIEKLTNEGKLKTGVTNNNIGKHLLMVKNLLDEELITKIEHDVICLNYILQCANAKSKSSKDNKIDVTYVVE